PRASGSTAPRRTRTSSGGTSPTRTRSCIVTDRWPEGWRIVPFEGWDDGFAASMGGGHYEFGYYLQRWIPGRKKRFSKKILPGHWTIFLSTNLGRNRPTPAVKQQVERSFLRTIKLVMRGEKNLTTESSA